MEELILTTPVVTPPAITPEKTTTKYHVVSITLNMEGFGPTSVEPGFVHLALKSDVGILLTHYYEGAQAQQMIRTLNTANLSTKSLQKRILEKLSADGILPGTVTGTPDPVA